MGEPITVYGKNGKPRQVYGRAVLDEILASGDYVLEEPTPKAAGKAAAGKEPIEAVITVEKEPAGKGKNK